MQQAALRAAADAERKSPTVLAESTVRRV